MLNLLFISNSPKIEYIKNVLQPMLKVIIDIVPDFDHGLKDVFEKRPATVCIQDQIAGVTGESVARHIQMLLGEGSPKFILIHEGSNKAKQIRGLFEYVVDLNQPEAKLAEEIQGALKLITGDQWDKIFIPVKQAPSAQGSSVFLSEESREDADKLVDDFLSDLETSGFSVANDAAPVLHNETEIKPTDSVVIQSTSDELVEMLLEQANKDRQAGIAAETLYSDAAGPGIKDSPETDRPPKSAKIQIAGSPPPALIQDEPSKPVRSGAVRAKPNTKPAAEKPVVPPKSQAAAVKSDQAVSETAGQTPPPVAPAEFRIKHGKSEAEDRIPDDLLQAFEENYRSESDSKKRMLLSVFVLLLIIVAGAFYYVKLNPDLLASLKLRSVPVVKPAAAPAVIPQSPAAQPMPVDQKPVPPTAGKTASPAVLPAFIPREGHDKSYAANKPGWERYIGKQFEFRVFSSGDKTKAIQILAINGSVIPDSLVKTVLTELTGSAEYKTSSKEEKSGFLVLRGTVANKADLLFYRKNSALRALVVSLY